MKLVEQLSKFKQEVPDCIQYSFTDKMSFKGTADSKLHQWLDRIYEDAVKEFKLHGTTNTADFLFKLILNKTPKKRKR